jgi:histidyl-tRNA synthetase
MWQWLEQVYRDTAHHFGYAEIRTPVFEDLKLFTRTAGEHSDIVTKEMYDFKDKGDRDIALKPEGTAPVIRAAIEHNLCPQGAHSRMYYATACYRYNRSQKGRLRELHQFGAEFMGSKSSAADAEVLELAYRFLEAVGLGGEPISINSIGRSECRKAFSACILDHVASFLETTEDDVKSRILKNPMGMLDSKDPGQQEALQGLPSIHNFLEPESTERFAQLQELLTEAGVPYKVAPNVVRGLDYYTETVFEFESQHLEGLSIFGGGRYDLLVKQLGGADTPCVGYGIGVERLILALQAKAIQPPAVKPDIFFVSATDAAASIIRQLARELRGAGKTVLLDTDNRSMKSQMRQADASGARFAAIIGEDEVANGTVSLKNLESGEQLQVKLEDVKVAI